MKIVNLDGRGLNPGDLSWEPLEQLGQVTIYDSTATEAQAIERIGDAEVVLVNKFPISATLLDHCPSIKLIAVQATGYNMVDCAAAQARGVLVCNVPSYGTAAVAQFTLALMLELCHQVGLHNASVQQGDWCRRGIFSYWLTPQMELAGKTLGILGFGRIGQAVAKLGRAFGMEVLAYSRRQTQEGQALAAYVSLEELLRRSDFLSLHCPLTSETGKIINAQALSWMKDGAFLVNTSRGPLVDEDALAQALRSGKLRGAALDVVSQEPILPENPLLNCPNCLLTPHMAWAPQESRQRLLDCVVENIRAFQEGRPQNVVNG